MTSGSTPAVPGGIRRPVEPVSAYRVALDDSRRTLERRATCYRNLVVGVVLLGMGSIGATLWLRDSSVLSCLLLLVPLCGLFYYLDAQLLIGWRSRLLESWVSGAIDFSAFTDAIRATPTLPKETLLAMLTGLPVVGALTAEQAISSTSRQAVASIVKAVYACRADLLGLKTAAATAAVVALVWAVMHGTWYPLPGVGVVVLPPLLAGIAGRLRLRDARAALLAVRLDPSFDSQAFERLVLGFDWQPIPAVAKAGFVAALRPSAPPHRGR
jgi:hypothetical protein